MLFAPEKKQLPESELPLPQEQSSLYITTARQNLSIINDLLKNEDPNWYETLTDHGLQPDAPKNSFKNQRQISSYLFFLEKTLLRELTDWNTTHAELEIAARECSVEELDALHTEFAQWAPIIQHLEILATISPEQAPPITQLLEVARILTDVNTTQNEATLQQIAQMLMQVHLHFSACTIPLYTLLPIKIRETIARNLVTESTRGGRQLGTAMATLFTPQLLSLLINSHAVAEVDKKFALSEQEVRETLSYSAQSEMFFKPFAEFYQLSNQIMQLNSRTKHTSDKKHRALVARLLVEKMEDGLIGAQVAQELFDEATGSAISTENATTDRLLLHCQQFLFGLDFSLSEAEKAEVAEILGEGKKKKIRRKNKRLSEFRTKITSRRALLLATIVLLLTRSEPDLPYTSLDPMEVRAAVTDFTESFIDTGEMIGSRVMERFWPDFVLSSDETTPASARQEVTSPEELTDKQVAQVTDFLSDQSEHAADQARDLMDAATTSVTSSLPAAENNANPGPVSPEGYVSASKQISWQFHNFTTNPTMIGVEHYEQYDSSIPAFVSTLPSESDVGSTLQYLDPQSYGTASNVVYMETATVNRDWFYIPTIDGYTLRSGSLVAKSPTTAPIPATLEFIHLSGDREQYARLQDPAQLGTFPSDATFVVAFQYVPGTVVELPQREIKAEPFLSLSDLPTELQQLIIELNDSALPEIEKLLQVKQWLQNFGTYSFDPKNNQRSVIDFLTGDTQLSSIEKERLFYQVFFGTSSLPIPVSPDGTAYPIPGAGECNRQNQSGWHVMQLLNLHEWDVDLQVAYVNSSQSHSVTEADKHLYLFATNLTTGEVINLDVTSSRPDSFTQKILNGIPAAQAQSENGLNFGSINLDQASIAEQREEQIDLSSVTPEIAQEIIDAYTIMPDAEIVAQAADTPIVLNVDSILRKPGNDMLTQLDIPLDQVNLPWKWIEGGKLIDLTDNRFLTIIHTAINIPVDMVGGTPRLTFTPFLRTAPFILTGEDLLVQPTGLIESATTTTEAYDLYINAATNIVPLLITNEMTISIYNNRLGIDASSIVVTVGGHRIQHTITALITPLDKYNLDNYFVVLDIPPELLNGQKVHIEYQLKQKKYPAPAGEFLGDVSAVDKVTSLSDQLQKANDEIYGSISWTKLIKPLSTVVTENPHIPADVLNRVAINILFDVVQNHSTQVSWAVDNLLPSLNPQTIEKIQALATISELPANMYQSSDAYGQTLTAYAQYLDTFYGEKIAPYYSSENNSESKLSNLVTQLIEEGYIPNQSYATNLSVVQALTASTLFSTYPTTPGVVDNFFLQMESHAIAFTKTEALSQVGASFVDQLAKQEYFTPFSEGYDACSKLYPRNTDAVLGCLWTLPNQLPWSNALLLTDVEDAFSAVPLPPPMANVRDSLTANFSGFDELRSAITRSLFGVESIDHLDALSYVMQASALSPSRFPDYYADYEYNLGTMADETKILGQVADENNQAELLRQIVPQQQEQLTNWWISYATKSMLEPQKSNNIFYNLKLFFALSALFSYIGIRKRHIAHRLVPRELRRPFVGVNRAAYQKVVGDSRVLLGEAFSMDSLGVERLTQDMTLPSIIPPHRLGKIDGHGSFRSEGRLVGSLATVLGLGDVRNKLEDTIFLAKPGLRSENPWGSSEVPPTYENIIAFVGSSGIIAAILSEIAPKFAKDEEVVEQVKKPIATGVDDSPEPTPKSFKTNSLVLTNAAMFQELMFQRLVDNFELVAQKDLGPLDLELIRDLATEATQGWLTIMQNWQQFNRL